MPGTEITCAAAPPGWPAFCEEMRQRSAEKARTPLPADDTHRATARPAQSARFPQAGNHFSVQD